jgi:F420H(2)-dependent quinone reductase
MSGPSSDDRGSALWRIIWRAGYAVIRLLDPLIRRAWKARLPGLAPLIELDVVGRRTGRTRSTIVTALTLGGASYVGHPNGEVAWTRNVAAAGTARVVSADGSRQQVRAVRLPPGPERESVIRATWSQQPFPANLLYSAARNHVGRVGVYFRLEPVPA